MSEKQVRALIDDDPSPQTDRELALRITIEELRVRYRNYLYLGLFGLFLSALLATYAIDVYNDRKASIEQNYRDIEQLITSAYRADPDAHAEVVRRFPVLLKGRLPKKLKRLQAAPIVEQSIADNPNLKSTKVVQDPGLLIAPRPSLKIYSDRSEASISLGTIDDVSGVSVKMRRGNWSSLALTTGVPVWISAAYVEELKPSLVRVSASRVGLRIKPESSKEFIVGVVDIDDTLKVISKQGDWYQVRAPANLEIWAKTEEIDRFVGQLQGAGSESPGTSVSSTGDSAEFLSEPSPIAVGNDAVGNGSISNDAAVLRLYSDRSEQSIFLRNITDDSEIISKKQRGRWTAVTLATSIPVWIAAQYVAEEQPSLVQVTASRVGIRAKPDHSKKYIVGVVDSDETLEVIAKQDGWYQVKAPANFEAWVKSADLESFIKLVTEQTKQANPSPAAAQLPSAVTTVSADETQLTSAIIPVQVGISKPKLKLYQDKAESSILLGSIKDDSEIIAIKRQGEWASIMLSTGIPVWLSAAYATELSTSLVKVSAADVGLRIRPELSREFIVATVQNGDTLQMLAKRGSWYRVNTPADFRAWVKTADLNRLLE